MDIKRRKQQPDVKDFENLHTLRLAKAPQR